MLKEGLLQIKTKRPGEDGWGDAVRGTKTCSSPWGGGSEKGRIQGREGGNRGLRTGKGWRGPRGKGEANCISIGVERTRTREGKRTPEHQIYLKTCYKRGVCGRKIRRSVGGLPVAKKKFVRKCP